MMTAPAKIFFTSDQHFFHSNIIKFCSRPFKDALSMNEAIVERWNAKIPRDGLTYVIGDVSMNAKPEAVVELLKRLNGEKILVAGNHDSHLLKDEGFRRCFTFIHNFLEIYVQDPEMEGGRAHITLCHYPMLVWNRSHHDSIMLHGHCHNSAVYPNKDLRILDIGVDNNNYQPFSYSDVIERLPKVKVKQAKKNVNQLSLF